MIKIDIRTLPPKNPKITLRRIFGEEGSAGTVASSKVVTSETFVTSIIFSAAILRKALAMRAASLSCQVNVKTDMDIEVPEEVFGVKK